MSKYRLNFKKLKKYAIHITSGGSPVSILYLNYPLNSRGDDHISLVSEFDLNDKSNFKLTEEAYLQFQKSVLSKRSYYVSNDNFEIFLDTHVNIVDVSGFDCIYRPRRFEGAVERDLYTRWGPAGFGWSFIKYRKEFNWSYQTINDIEWLMCDTLTDEHPSQVVNKAFYLPLSCDRILTIEFHTYEKIPVSGRKYFYTFFTDVATKFINQVSMSWNDNILQEYEQVRRLYPDEVKTKTRDAFNWEEFSLDSRTVIDSDNEGVTYIDITDSIFSPGEEELEQDTNTKPEYVYLLSPFETGPEKKINVPCNVKVMDKIGQLQLQQEKKAYEILRKTLVSQLPNGIP